MAASDETSAAFAEALEEVHTRFVLNLPDSELKTADRIFFQIEQAWWFYEDLICDVHPEWNLPRFSSLKPFSLKLFEYSPLLPDVKEFPAMWASFNNYKRKISNYGCILMNRDCSKFVLCRVWNGKSYTFPSGKINQGEEGNAAAARETYEETGFDPAAKFGTTAEWLQQDPTKITWNMVLPESDALTVKDDNGKSRIAYVVVGVPEDFPFQPVARKEVSDVSWFSLDEIPKNSYAVLPFMGHLKNWIRKNKKGANRRSGSNRNGGSRSNTPKDTPDRRKGTNNKSNTNTPNRSRNSRGRVTQQGDDIVRTGLAHAGEVSGWSEEEMFRVNEKLIGRRVDYDGNPHVFAEEGFRGTDPHAFRIIGGAFSSGIQSLAPPPERSKLQPLFHSKSDTDELTPFFSGEGVTPWGEVVEGACDKGSAPAKSSQRKATSKKKESNTRSSMGETDADELFLTDREITSKSQQSKHSSLPSILEMLRKQCEDDTKYIQQWAARLPKPMPTRIFGELKLDIDRIMVEVSRVLKVDL
ncbi:mRNA-decapping enzyme subunit 2 [Fistulifera solaris]|uniref:mRNA-decapping enzyme subunit 2 n=1 Tax=Fistulifera solaris TaxID=1519565 RepID=A0A1Z5KG27_FISSO|nr:mRNA-decapping enzyme subunit 2 [Fistulifera solaris]|eukprot:GAX24918.1 mRNA-decapping enzyme subunit 2 [Fistulifera solaris]